jgi:hypothetical protein
MNELLVINVRNIFSKVKKVLFWDPCFFLLCRNNLPKIINNKCIHILFADDTSVLFTNSNLTNYNKDIYTAFKLINKWFKRNFLSLNFEKTHKNNPTINMYRLEFITNLMQNFIYSMIILHHDPQHVLSITVLIFRRMIVYLQYLVSSHSVWQHTECDDTRYCKYTIVLLKMSTAMLETC